MTATQCLKTVNLVVGVTDMNNQYGAALTINSNGRVVLTSAANQTIVGFLAENPGRTTVDGQDRVPVVLVAGGGVGMARAAVAITAGQLVVSHTTNGRVQGVANIAALGNNQVAAGYALETASAGEFFQVLLTPVGG